MRAQCLQLNAATLMCRRCCRRARPPAVACRAPACNHAALLVAAARNTVLAAAVAMGAMGTSAGISAGGCEADDARLSSDDERSLGQVVLRRRCC